MKDIDNVYCVRHINKLEMRNTGIVQEWGMGNLFLIIESNLHNFPCKIP